MQVYSISVTSMFGLPEPSRSDHTPHSQALSSEGLHQQLGASSEAEQRFQQVLDYFQVAYDADNPRSLH